MTGLLIEAAVHWLDCELLKASVLRRLGERERGGLPREGAQSGYGRDFTCSCSFIPSLSSRVSVCSLALSPSVRHSVPSLVFLSHTLSGSQKLLFSLGGSFLYYADHFKLYSGFCANHIKVQKVMERGTTHT